MVDLQLLQSVSYMVGALGVGVAAVYYIMTLRAQQENMKNTLLTRQTQLFMSTMFDKLSSSEVGKARAYLDQHIPKTLTEWEGIMDDPEISAAWQSVWWTYEGIGVLVHEGLLDIRLVARMIGNTFKSAWENWGPIYKEARVKWSFPRYAIECEYLYDRLMEFGKLNPDYHIVDSDYKGVS